MKGLMWLGLFAILMGFCITLMVLGITVAYTKPLMFLGVLGFTLEGMAAALLLLAGRAVIKAKLAARKDKHNE